MDEVRIVQADLSDPVHAEAVRELTSAYSMDEMGNGKPLPADVLERLIPALRAHPTTVIFLAYSGPQAVGIATCFIGFSTFAARELINIHDLAVLGTHRGRGVGRALLKAVEDYARRRGCVKVTLEVLENNPARTLYEAAGFKQMDYNTAAGSALFYTKKL
ncbi:MAG TPA: GNAT family N-acetyltransferase [Planctomycetota bacterium]|nr:GNAT family N-acetyltransferase [Planctomycetota bacterium]